MRCPPPIAAALAFAVLAACSPVHDRAPARASKAALPFIENDWPTALARARAANIPVFVDVWAPW